MLFLLLHGEGANCRHCPEMLCAFFLTMALALRPPGEPAGGARALGDIEARESWSNSGVRGSAEARETSDTEVTSGRYPLCHAALGSRLGLPHRDYLRRSSRQCTPSSRTSSSGGRAEAVEARVLYDDVNEFFWDARNVGALCGGADIGARLAGGASHNLYAAMRETLIGVPDAASPTRASESARRRRRSRCSRLFRKTHFERISWSNCSSRTAASSRCRRSSGA